MEKIASFQVDHTDLRPGIYVSRKDQVGGEVITTYDIRMTAPNHEPAVQQSALHTIEHLVATYIRNREDWKERVIYWGPMGCQTGNYLILRGDFTPEEVRPLMIEAFQFVVDYTGEIPGNTPDACGNYLLHDLPMAQWESRRYVRRLLDEFCCVYPVAP